MQSASLRNRHYFENLDGLRFVCFLLVFFFHSFHTEIDSIRESSVYRFVKFDIFGNGNLGVNFFFVLSGFLISFLLLEEKSNNPRIDVVNFWKRRILRIWPLFYFCVIFGFFLFPILKNVMGAKSDETANLLPYLLFLNNFDFIANGLPDASILGVLWSIAIEEQFYFFWPLMFFVLDSKYYLVSFMSIILISMVFVALNDSPTVREYHTLSCMGDLAVGAIGALIARSSAAIIRIDSLSRLSLWVLYGLVLILIFFRDEIFSSGFVPHAIERPIIAFIFLGVILEQCYCSNSLFKMSSFPIVSRLGRITYGLYCLHFLAILITTNATAFLGLNQSLLEVLVLETSVALMISIILATISFRYFESPFLRLKEKYAYRHVNI